MYVPSVKVAPVYLSQTPALFFLNQSPLPLSILKYAGAPVVTVTVGFLYAPPYTGMVAVSEVPSTLFTFVRSAGFSVVISFFMRSSCVFSLPASTHVGASAAFALNVPRPARGRTPSSITSVRSRQMTLFVILFILFLLLFGFLFLFCPRQLFAADMAVVRVRSCHRTAFRAPVCRKRYRFPSAETFQVKQAAALLLVLW